MPDGRHQTTTSSWDASCSQLRLMQTDLCIAVDLNDEVVGSVTKYDAHRFADQAPTGTLHRAFSVMLFDSEGRLLLQKRASSKITFPCAWTNTCCSHPLHGQTPDELDTPEALHEGREPTGVKHAAVRKLMHELGIKPGVLRSDGFKYMGRVHYCSADTVTRSEDAAWGEHEIDYLLLYRLPFPASDMHVVPHPDEVMEIAWVTANELWRRMDEGGARWSPWFRIIARHLLEEWWDDLDKAFERPAHGAILRFDAAAAPPRICRSAVDV